MNQKPRTITLKEFTKNFTPEQKRIVEEETQYFSSIKVGERCVLYQVMCLDSVFMQH